MPKTIGLVLALLVVSWMFYTYRAQASSNEVLDQYRWHEWVVTHGDKWDFDSRHDCIREQFWRTNIYFCNYRFLGHS